MKKFARYAIFAGLWSVLLIPFYVATEMFFPYITGKNFAFRIIIEIIFVLWVYLAYVDAKYRPKLSWLLKMIGLFVFVMLIADIFAVNPMKALWSNYERMDGWITIIHMFMYFLIFSAMMKTEKIWLWFFRSSVAMSAIMSIIAIREYVAGGSVATMTTLGNTIYVAVYFLFNFFFALILLYKDVIIKSAGTFKSILSQWLTYVYLAAAVLFAYGIWITATRGAILGLIGGLVMTALIIIFFEKENKMAKKLSIGLVAAIVIIVGGFFAVRNTQFVKHDPILESFAVISWNSINGQGQARQLIWPLAIKGFLEKPILGWGQEGFNYVFNKFYDPRLFNQEQWFDRAHDEPLDVLVAGGILGLLAYLSIFVAAIYLLWKRKNTLGVIDAALLVGLLAAYFFQGLFVFDNLFSYVFFYTVLAYIHSHDVENALLAAPPKDAPKEKNGNDEIANYVLLPALVIALCVSLWYVNIKPIEANLNLIQAMQGYADGPSENLQYFQKAFSYHTFGDPEIREQLITLGAQVYSASTVDATTKQTFVSYAYTQMQEQLAQTPLDARYQLFMGTFLDNIEQYQLAIPYLQKAVSLSPDKQTIMFELERAYSYTGDYTDALLTGEKAYELDTDDADAKDNYIAGAILNNDTSLVSQLWGNATSTTDSVIIQSYLILASADLQKGDKADAISEVEKAIAIAPSFASQGNSIIQEIQSGTLK